MQTSDEERQDRERRNKIAAMQKLVDEGLASGFGTRTKDELFAAALASFEASQMKTASDQPAADGERR